jgi:maltooligosyltrehalose synthase
MRFEHNFCSRSMQRLESDRAQCMRDLRRDWRDGGIKLATIATLLRHRQNHEQLYAEGDYQPLPAIGARADDLCAFARTRSGKRLIVAVARRASSLAGRDGVARHRAADSGRVATRAWRELLSGRVDRPSVRDGPGVGAVRRAGGGRAGV